MGGLRTSPLRYGPCVSRTRITCSRSNLRIALPGAIWMSSKTIFAPGRAANCMSRMSRSLAPVWSPSMKMRSHER